MIAQIFQKVSIWVIVIPFLVGIMNYRGLNRDSRWIFFLVSIAIIPQIFTAVFEEENALLNISYNLYTPIEFSVFFIIFISKYTRSSSLIIIQISSILYFIVCSYFFAAFGIEEKFLSGLVCTNNIIYMLWILLLLKQEYGADETLIIKGNSFTWYFIAVIFYAPCTVATFALYYYIRDPVNPVRINLSVIQSAFNILLYLFFSIGLLIRKTYK